MVMTDDPLFVGISDPLAIRKGFLNSSREIMQVLVRVEEFKQARQAKLRLTAQLQKQMDELSVLERKMASLLPSPQSPSRMEPAKTKEILKKSAPAKSRLDELQDQLKAFEEKLGRIE